MTRLQGKRAVITGAGAGIGFSIAQTLARQGASVALLDVEADTVDAAARSLRDEGVDAIALTANVADDSAVRAAFDHVDEAFGGLDILINNAGITGNCEALNIDPAFWQLVIGVNQTGTLFCAQAAARRMRDAGGVILNLASIYGLVAAPNRLAYSATKAAVIQMSKVMAVEWARFGIRVNCIAPGYVETPGTDHLVRQGRIDLDALRARTPQGRLAKPSDIAGVIASFCDDGFAHVTGQVLAVDGGWTAYGYL
jgi:NAD(P)-dependent dehydrogenase (short-subunit alcohol dehydrogenase family)